jgi:Flp pilus assembly protein TadD
VGTVVGERLMYIPSAGFCLAVILWLHSKTTVQSVRPSMLSVPTEQSIAAGGTSKQKRQGQSARQQRHATVSEKVTLHQVTSSALPSFAGLCVAGLVLSALAIRTLIRVRNWESSDTLFLHDGYTQPSSSKTQFNLGITHMQNQEWDEAVKALMRCAWADPLSSLPFYRIGQIEILRGNYASAEGFLGAAIDKFGASLMVRDEEVFHDLAVAMFQNGKPDQAERRLKIALRLNPDFAKGWSNLACCIASYDLHNAMRAARKAATLAPENPQYWANLALLARHTRDEATATQAWQHATMLWPGMPAPRDCTWEFAPAG